MAFRPEHTHEMITFPMRIKNFIHQWIPPIILEHIHSYTSSRHFYSSYGTALAECGPGYLNCELAKIVVEKNRIFRDTLQKEKTLDLDVVRTSVGLLNPCSHAKQGTLRVIDFGGGAGYHHTIAKFLLGSSLRMRWNVVETAEMAHQAKSLETDELRFFDNLDAAQKDLGQVDLILASGSLPYCPDPLAMLSALLKIDAEYLFITRTHLSEDPSRSITIQNSLRSTNGPGPLPKGFADGVIRYPLTFESRKTFEDLIKTRYFIKRTFREGGIYKVRNKSFYMFGYMCDSRFT
jgi:putative methyltransferase (TIGR04325 family)